MKILYIASCGFGDVAWTSSWPRIWSEEGHEVDVFLMEYTGNPFHANPYIKRLFVEEIMKAAKKIKAVINDNSYDIIFMGDSNCGGVKEVIEVTKDLKNRYLLKGGSPAIIAGVKIPTETKPEFYFMEKELKYIQNLGLEDSVLFHPISSKVYEKSRNIDFDVIIECSKKIANIVVVYGGSKKFLPLEDLKKMEDTGIRLLWEGYNCFNDDSGTTLGKFFALTSMCKIAIHGWSGSASLSQAYGKPYVIAVPGNNLKRGLEYVSTEESIRFCMRRAEKYGCLYPSIWVITEDPNIIKDAVNHTLEGKTGTYIQKWVTL